MVPSRPTEQRKATAAAPRAGSGQHSSPSSPSSGAARASAGEALVWHFVCDEICDVLCEVLSADDVDDAARGPYWKFGSMVGEPYSFGVEPAKMASFWTKELGVKIIAHKTPEEQRAEWLDTPGAIELADGLLPHGGICHLFSLRLK